MGDKLMLVTTPTSIEEKIDWLQRMIESTNVRVEKFNQTQKIMQEAEEREALRKHENTIRNVLTLKLAVA